MAHLQSYVLAPPTRMNRPPKPGSRPRVWAIGISKLRDLFRDIADEYDTRADLRLVSRGYEDAVNEIAVAGKNRPDIVVAAGSNGTYLKARIDVPVVLVTPTGFDVMHALARARRDASSVALVTYGDTPAEVRRFVAAYGIDVVFAAYQSAQDAEACVLDLRDRGVKTIVGPGLVTDLAARAGMESVFLYSRASVRAAFDTALEVAQAALARRCRGTRCARPRRSHQPASCARARHRARCCGGPPVAGTRAGSGRRRTRC